MIRVTRLNGTELVINSDKIDTIEATPDTVLSMEDEQRYVVRESIDEVISRIVAFRRACHPEARFEGVS